MSWSTSLSPHGGSVRHGSHGKTYKRNTARADGRRAVKPGYPIDAREFTDDEVRKYLAGDRIECLLCGKTYKTLGRHLSVIHGCSDEEYRRRYGLPFTGGLCCVDTKRRHAAATGRTAAEMAELRKLARPPQAFRTSAVKRRQAVSSSLRLAGRERVTSTVDVDAAIATMSAEDVTFSEATTKLGLGHSAVSDLIRRTAGLRERINRAHDALSFVAQARGQRMGARFIAAIRLLRPSLSDHRIAEQLGVTSMTVNNARRRHGIP